MSSVQSLTEWNEQFGDMEFFPEKESSGGGYTFEYKVAYPCRVKKAKCVRSKLGDLQIELQFDVQGSDSEDDDVEVVGKSRVWLDLPKQPGDLKRDRELVIKLTQRRYQNLLRVLSAAAPARYSLYAEKKDVNGKNVFIDFDGEKMDGGDFNDRKQEIHSACVDFADNLTENEEIELLEDTLLYIEKRENERNAKYPYVNYYARKPDDVKVFSSESTPF